MKLVYLGRWRLRVLQALSFLFQATFDSVLFIISQEKNPATNTHLLFPFGLTHFLFPPNPAFSPFFRQLNFSNIIAIAQLSLPSFPRKAKYFFPRLPSIYSSRIIPSFPTSYLPNHSNVCNRKASFNNSDRRKLHNNRNRNHKYGKNTGKIWWVPQVLGWEVK